MDLLLLHQRLGRRRRSWSTCRAHYERKRAALDCHASQFQRRRRRRGGHAAEHAAVPPARRKPRRAVRRAAPASAGRKGSSCASRSCGRPDSRRPDLPRVTRGTDMNIGIVCYASIGGSGIIATELGKALASRGHRVHILSSDTPVRLGDYQPGLSFHRVETPSYPLFREPQYLLSLANKIVQVSRDERLDIVHAHYAIPHATAAYLARQILAAGRGACVPQVITTLHGTDITLLGSDRSYSETVAFCIEQSDGVTAVSESLKADTYRELGVTRDIRVIPNFLDCSVHRRRDVGRPARALAPARREAADPRVELPAGEARRRRSSRCSRASAQRVAGAAADGRRRPGPGRRVAARPRARASPTTSSSSASRIRSCRCSRRPTCSCCRRRRRASASRRSRRWPARCRSSRRASAGCPRSIEHGVTGFLHAPDDLDGHGRVGVMRLLTDAAAPPARCRGGAPRRARAVSATRRSCRSTRRITRRSSAVGR